MSRSLFEKIVSRVVSHNEYITRGVNPNCIGVLGATPLQKIVAAFRYIAYGSAADIIDEYVRLGESTILMSMKEFCNTLVQQYGPEYLRSSTKTELTNIVSSFAFIEFPGCMGALDCAAWQWDAFPKAFQGITFGKDIVPTLRMEVVCDMDLRIWHLCFGFPGSLNDLNILSISPLFTKILKGSYPEFEVSYNINREEFDWLYYIADGIYPHWKIFVSTVSSPKSSAEKRFASLQEAARKSVERVFGVLFKRFSILCRPSRLWFSDDMRTVIQACCVMHKMIVDERKGSYTGNGVGGVRAHILRGLSQDRSCHNNSHAGFFMNAPETDVQIEQRLDTQYGTGGKQRVKK